MAKQTVVVSRVGVLLTTDPLDVAAMKRHRERYPECGWVLVEYQRRWLRTWVTRCGSCGRIV